MLAVPLKQKYWKLRFRQPHCRLTPLSMGTPLISAQTLCYQKLGSLGYIFLLIVWVYLHSSLRVGLPKRMYFETECEMAVVGHPRSLISVPIESAHATSYWSSTVALVLSCPVSEILQIFCSEQRPHPYYTRILGCSAWTRLPMLWLRGAKTLS